MTTAAARALIARTLLPGAVPRRLGEVLLAPHQLHAAARLSDLLTRHGGALLADEVGLGKTFCALAVAARFRRVLVIHPAALRPMWSDALARTGVAATLASYEAFSRGDAQRDRWDLVILDEAHHARSATARRYAPIARACADAATLLLTATPLHNRRAELESLFALFLGERARQLDAATLRRLIVRRRHESLPAVRLPPVETPRWIEIPTDAATLALLERLPPPLAPADGGEAHVLLTWSLVRRWASSRAALRATLRRLLARAMAMQALLDAGRLPTQAELAAWTVSEDVVQAALPGFGLGVVHHAERGAAAEHAPASADALQIAAAARTLTAHMAGVRRLLQHLRASPEVDDLRAEALRALRAAHPGEKILAFSEFAETVHSYWHRLRRDPGVGRLTSRGGEIASGTLPREQMLHLFAPEGARRETPRAREAVGLLVTTDILAEGVDLRDATIIVHLDLPWSPARLEQRVGRARRLGSAATRIAVLAMRPPAPSEALLAVEQRLRAKARAARITIGTSGAVLPGSEAPEGDPGARSDPERLSAVMDLIAAWREEKLRDPAADEPDGCAVAFVRAREEACLALVRVAGTPHLIAGRGQDVSDAPAPVEQAVELLDRAADSPRRARPGHEGPMPTSPESGLPAPPEDDPRARRWYDAAVGWAAARAAEEAVGPVNERQPGLADRLLARTTAAWAELPAERRAVVAPQVERVRALAASRLPAGAADELMTLVHDRSLGTEAWLEAAHSLAIERDLGPARPAGHLSRDQDGDRLPSPCEEGVLVLVVFSPDPAPPCPA